MTWRILQDYQRLIVLLAFLISIVPHFLATPPSDGIGMAIFGMTLLVYLVLVYGIVQYKYMPHFSKLVLALAILGILSMIGSLVLLGMNPESINWESIFSSYSTAVVSGITTIILGLWIGNPTSNNPSLNLDGEPIKEKIQFHSMIGGLALIVLAIGFIAYAYFPNNSSPPTDKQAKMQWAIAKLKEFKKCTLDSDCTITPNPTSCDGTALNVKHVDDWNKIHTETGIAFNISDFPHPNCKAIPACENNYCQIRITDPGTLAVVIP